MIPGSRDIDRDFRNGLGLNWPVHEPSGSSGQYKPQLVTTLHHFLFIFGTGNSTTIRELTN